MIEKENGKDGQIVVVSILDLLVSVTIPFYPLEIKCIITKSNYAWKLVYFAEQQLREIRFPITFFFKIIIIKKGFFCLFVGLYVHEETRKYSASGPLTIDGLVYIGSRKSQNIHLVDNIEGHCDNIHKGKVRVGFWVGNCPGYGSVDAYTGWNSVSQIFIEEVPKPQS